MINKERQSVKSNIRAVFNAGNSRIDLRPLLLSCHNNDVTGTNNKIINNYFITRKLSRFLWDEVVVFIFIDPPFSTSFGDFALISFGDAIFLFLCESSFFGEGQADERGGQGTRYEVDEEYDKDDKEEQEE